MAATRNAAAVLCAIGCALSAAAVGALSCLAETPLLFPAIGASTFLVFYAPRSPLSCPRNMLCGHMIGAASGSLFAWLLGVTAHAPWLATEDPWRAAVAATLALALSGGLMARLDVPHAPAGATTLIFATGLMGGPLEGAAVASAVMVLTAVGSLVHRFTGEPFPLWAPSAVPVPPRMVPVAHAPVSAGASETAPSAALERAAVGGS